MKTWMLLLCGLLWPISQSYAGIGNITEQLNTPPSIQRKNQSITGAKGTGVEMADSIRTAQGKVGITFDDNTKVQVNENSKLVIDDFVYDANKKTGKLALNMALGTVRYASGQIAKNDPQKVALNTPSATISVRGTDFTATVDEVGASTIILLPSCPNDRKTRTRDDIEANCVTGSIVVESDAGQVILNQAFQATRVANRSSIPAKPVILRLSEDAINNMLIVSPPREIREGRTEIKATNNPLDKDFFKFDGLDNVLEAQMANMYQDKLSRNFLDSDYLANLFEVMGNALNEDFLKDTDNMLPDYKKSSGIVVTKDDPQITLCRDTGSDRQCVTTPQTQSSTIYQTQGSLEFKNRVNQGGGTVITLIQR
jgi:hypothetical protein